MAIRDYNGDGIWRADEIVARYRRHAAAFGITPRAIAPRTTTQGDVTWVWPVLHQIIAGIEAQDLACAQIGIELLEEDRGFPFGAILKSNTARALRRCRGLNAAQVERIRRRIVELYATGIVPREFVQYRKLLRQVGVGAHWPAIVAAAPRNHFARQARAWFLSRFDAEGRPLADPSSQR
jgi:hypothetical protein